jgi:hypothetical protein
MSWPTTAPIYRWRRRAFRVDTKILETLIELDLGTALPIGLRVDAFLERANELPEPHMEKP